MTKEQFICTVPGGPWTPTQARILEMLRDGMTHPPSEVLTCLEDPQGELATLYVHISTIRKKLRPVGLDILIRMVHSRSQYIMVRLLSPQDGVREAAPPNGKPV